MKDGKPLELSHLFYIAVRPRSNNMKQVKDNFLSGHPIIAKVLTLK